jgi:hypothetical protein
MPRRYRVFPSAACVLCPSGKFQANATGDGAGGHVNECRVCDPGRFQYHYGRRHCAACPLGKYQLYSGRAHCRLRPHVEAKVACSSWPR